MDKENLESGIWKRILEVWNLEIGIPDLSAVIVASRLDLGQGLQQEQGEEQAHNGGQSKALLLEE